MPVHLVLPLYISPHPYPPFPPAYSGYLARVRYGRQQPRSALVASRWGQQPQPKARSIVLGAGIRTSTSSQRASLSAPSLPSRPRQPLFANPRDHAATIIQAHYRCVLSVLGAYHAGMLIPLVVALAHLHNKTCLVLWVALHGCDCPFICHLVPTQRPVAFFRAAVWLQRYKEAEFPAFLAVSF
jgi:hypothetical protein